MLFKINLSKMCSTAQWIAGTSYVMYAHTSQIEKLSFSWYQENDTVRARCIAFQWKM